MSKLVRAALIIPTLAILAVSSATVAMADNGVNLSVEPTRRSPRGSKCK